MHPENGVFYRKPQSYALGAMLLMHLLADSNGFSFEVARRTRGNRYKGCIPSELIGLSTSTTYETVL